MKKLINVLMWVCFIIIALSSLAALTINVEFEATKQDLLMYRLGGFFLLFIFALGFLFETDMFCVRKKLKLVTLKRQIVFWTIISVMGIMVFCVCFGMTSERFRTEISTSSSSLVPSPTKTPKSTPKPTAVPTVATKPIEKLTPTNTPKPTSIIKDVTPTPTVIPEKADIDGYVFHFKDAIYEVNGLEVTFYSVQFVREVAIYGYSTTFEYSVKNVGTTVATLEFENINQMYFGNDKIAILAVQAINSMKPGHETSYRLQPGEETEKTKILLTATSSATDKRIDGIDYPKVDIGNIMSTEPITLDITFTGRINDNQESIKVSFNINEGIEITPTNAPTLTPTVTPVPISSPVQEPEVSLEDSWFSVVYFDVGQGDAAIIECDGKYMLIDGGPSSYSSTLYSYLKEWGIDKLDIVVASHAHDDHVGGLAGALNYAKADLILCPVTEYDTDEFRAFKKYAEKNGPGITVPKVGDTYQLSNATITINGVNAGADNDSSIIMTIEYRDTKFVFTGDAEYAAEVAAVKNIEGPVLALKVSHHGSDTASTYQFLRKLVPAYAIISCGYGNEYGHPTEKVLSRLNDADVEILRTDLNGEIVFEYTEDEWYYSYEKETDYADILTPGGYYTLVPDVTENIDSGDRSNTSSSSMDYVGNANTMVFHYPGCSSVKRMKESNKRYHENVTRDDMIAMGYKSCENCNP